MESVLDTFRKECVEKKWHKVAEKLVEEFASTSEEKTRSLIVTPSLAYYAQVDTCLIELVGSPARFTILVTSLNQIGCVDNVKTWILKPHCKMKRVGTLAVKNVIIPFLRHYEFDKGKAIYARNLKDQNDA